jgi:hypothetical protein
MRLCKSLNLRLTQFKHSRGNPLATPNYSFAKRQREIAKKAKKEEKLKRKADGGADTSAPEEPATPASNTEPPAIEKDTP